MYYNSTTIDGTTTFLYNEKSGVDNMEYHQKKKSITEKIIRLFSHKLHLIEKRQNYIFILAESNRQNQSNLPIYP